MYRFYRTTKNKIATLIPTSPIPVYYLSRLSATNVDRFNERKCLYAGKVKKQKIPRTNDNVSKLE